jgi:acetyl-CoA synthetase
LKVGRDVPPGLFKGYYRDQDYTDNVWHDGYYYTGDLARRDADGYYWFAGRNDRLIKSSGYRIGPFEVESVLLEHAAVKECKVTGRPDPDRGQAVKAFVVLREGYAPGRKLVKELQDYVKSVTAPYKYPRYIEFVEEIPKTFNGKIKRL